MLVGEKIQKVYKGSESNSMGTSAQAGGHRSKKGFKKGEKAIDHQKKDLEFE